MTSDPASNLSRTGDHNLVRKANPPADVAEVMRAAAARQVEANIRRVIDTNQQVAAALDPFGAAMRELLQKSDKELQTKIRDFAHSLGEAVSPRVPESPHSGPTPQFGTIVPGGVSVFYYPFSTYWTSTPNDDPGDPSQPWVTPYPVRSPPNELAQFGITTAGSYGGQLYGNSRSGNGYFQYGQFIEAPVDVLVQARPLITFDYNWTDVSHLWYSASSSAAIYVFVNDSSGQLIATSEQPLWNDNVSNFSATHNAPDSGGNLSYSPAGNLDFSMNAGEVYLWSLAIVGAASDHGLVFDFFGLDAGSMATFRAMCRMPYLFCSAGAT